MDSLNLLRHYLCLLGIFRRNPKRSALNYQIAANCFLRGSMIIYTVTTLWNFLSTTKTFAQYTECFFYFSGSLLFFKLYLILFWQREQYAVLLNDLERIVEKRNHNSVTALIYQKTDQKFGTLTRNLSMILLKIVNPIFTLFPVVASIYVYVSSNFTEKRFHLIYPASYPFDWKTPAGYLCGAFNQLNTMYVIAVVFVMFFILTVGLCLFPVAFIADIKQNLQKLNEGLILHRNQMLSLREEIDLKNQLIDIIQFHCEAKEFTNRFVDINSGMIFVYLFYRILSVSCIFLHVTKCFAAGRYIDTFQFIVPALTVIVWLYIFCHYGNKLTQHFEEVGEVVYQIAWYSMPMPFQKCFPLMIAAAQRKVYLRGMANVHCTRQMFMKIIKSAYSFFAVLKKFIS